MHKVQHSVGKSKSLIEKNIDYYSNFLVADNILRHGSLISKMLQEAYFYVTNTVEGIALRQCKRQGFRPAGSKFWGYHCFHLEDVPGQERLYEYAVNWFEDRPYPAFFRGWEPRVVAHKNQAVKMYDDLPNFQPITFCTINVAIYLEKFGAHSLASQFLSHYPNDLLDMLENKHSEKELKYDNIFSFENVTYEQAIELSDKGLFVFAIKKEKEIGHTAPICGSDVWVKRDNKVKTTTDEKCAYCLNIGRNDRILPLDGYNSIFRSFYVTKLDGIKYYALVRSDV